MEIVTHEDTIEEILIEDVIKKTDDRGKVITPNNPLNSKIGTVISERRDDISKEMIAYDSMEMGSRTAGNLHGTGNRTANAYANGERIEDPEVRTRILQTKHNIADKAVAQLMETLNLFDPNAIEKQTDVIRAAGMLAGIVEKVTENKKEGDKEVHLHLYAPKQNKIDKYEIIDVP